MRYYEDLQILYIDPHAFDLKVLENGAIIASPCTYYSDNIDE